MAVRVIKSYYLQIFALEQGTPSATEWLLELKPSLAISPEEET